MYFSVLQKFKAWLIKHPDAPENAAGTAKNTSDTGQYTHEDAQHLVAFDESLLKHSRIQWQFGDWKSLAKLERDTFQHHPDRAKLALHALQHFQSAIQTGVAHGELRLQYMPAGPKPAF